jgi:DNA-binding transcriptional ArsR family regulator
MATKTAGGKTRRTPKEGTLEERLAKAMSHPLRAKILAMLNTNPASPSELDRQIPDQPLSNISYHVKELLGWKLIEVVHKEQVRGAMKTVYRGTTKMQLDDEAWLKMSAESKDGISIEAVREVLERADCAIRGGTFDKRSDRHVITMIPDLDERGWGEVAGVIASTYGRINDIAAEVVNREPDPGKRFRATISMLSYESPSCRPPTQLTPSTRVTP